MKLYQFGNSTERMDFFSKKERKTERMDNKSFSHVHQKLKLKRMRQMEFLTVKPYQSTHKRTSAIPQNIFPRNIGT